MVIYLLLLFSILARANYLTIDEKCWGGAGGGGWGVGGGWEGVCDFFRVVILPSLTVWALGWFK